MEAKVHQAYLATARAEYKDKIDKPRITNGDRWNIHDPVTDVWGGLNAWLNYPNRWWHLEQAAETAHQEPKWLGANAAHRMMQEYFLCEHMDVENAVCRQHTIDPESKTTRPWDQHGHHGPGPHEEVCLTEAAK